MRSITGCHLKIFPRVKCTIKEMDYRKQEHLIFE